MLAGVILAFFIVGMIVSKMFSVAEEKESLGLGLSAIILVLMVVFIAVIMTKTLQLSFLN